MAHDVDVVTSIRIERPRPQVASYAAEPSHAPEWYVNIESVQWQSTPVLDVGARMTFVAQFLGRRLEYTYEIVRYGPNEVLVMRTADGPFPVETTYEWKDTDDDATLMILRNRGRPSGFSKLAAPLLAAAIARANRKDLKRLKAILENG